MPRTKGPQMLIVHMNKTFRVRSNEWFMAAVVFLWGVVLIQPQETFTQPSYSILAQHASEDTWAIFCLVGGGLRLLALAINGAMRPSPHVRAVLAFLSAFFFLQLAFGFLTAGTLSTGLAVYPAAAVFDFVNALHAIGDAADVDRKHKENARDPA